MSVFALRLPEELKEQAAAQAAKSGMSLNQFIAVALATHVGAQAEAQRYFSARAARSSPGQAKAILAKAGIGNPPRDDDRIDEL
jgi:hypothetical protein